MKNKCGWSKVKAQAQGDSQDAKNLHNLAEAWANAMETAMNGIKTEVWQIADRTLAELQMKYSVVPERDSMIRLLKKHWEHGAALAKHYGIV